MRGLFVKVFSIVMIVLIMLFILIMAIQNYRADFLTHIVVPMLFPEPVTTRVAAIILLSYVLGGFTGAIYVLKVNAECDDAIDYYRKKITQISKNTDADSSLIDSLQRKISSLEIALENALKDKENN